MAEVLKGSQLAQSRPSDTNAVSVLSPTGSQIFEVMTIYIANNTGSARKFRLFHDEDGTTYDENTAIYYDKTVDANDTLKLTDCGIWLRNENGNLAVRTDSADALTFTVFGTIEDG